MPQWLRLTSGFWITLLLMAVLWAATTAMTLSAPSYDGAVLVGFPLPFYAMGGHCTGPCDTTIAWPIVAFDSVALLGIPGLVNWVILRWRKYRNEKLHQRRKTDQKKGIW